MNKVSISDSEWKIMKIIWNDHPITANEIVKKLQGKTDWKEKTIKTLISRLVKKDLLAFEKEGREYRYYPLLSEDDCIQKENVSFLNKVHNGKLNVMLMSFLQNEDLTEDEIEKLKKILDGKK